MALESSESVKIPKDNLETNCGKSNRALREDIKR